MNGCTDPAGVPVVAVLNATACELTGHAYVEDRMVVEALSTFNTSVKGYVLWDETVRESLLVAYPAAGVTDTLGAGEYRFFTLYVGPEDEAMYVAERSHAGHRTGDLGTDPDTWGIDWTEPLTQTWVEQQRDEWDLDVDVLIDAVTDGVHVYGSSREPYPSAIPLLAREEGYVGGVRRERVR